MSEDGSPDISDEKDKPTRITIDLSPQQHSKLEELMKFTDANSKAEVVRKAILLYEQIAREVTNGTKIMLVTPEGEKTSLVFLGLSTPE